MEAIVLDVTTLAHVNPKHRTASSLDSNHSSIGSQETKAGLGLTRTELQSRKNSGKMQERGQMLDRCSALEAQIRMYTGLRDTMLAKFGGWMKPKSAPILLTNEADPLTETPAKLSEMNQKVHQKCQVLAKNHSLVAQKSLVRSLNERRVRAIAHYKARLSWSSVHMSLYDFLMLEKTGSDISLKAFIGMTKGHLREKVIERAKRVELAGTMERGKEELGRYMKGRAILQITLRAAYKAFKGLKQDRNPALPLGIDRKVRSTAHINAVMNALYHLPSLKSALMAMESSHLSKEMTQLLAQFCKEGQFPLSEKSRFYYLLTALPGLGGGHKNCANAFLLKLLAKLDSDLACPQAHILQISPFSSQLEVYQRKKCKEMHNLFSALVETVYICSHCFTSWNTFAYSRSISLPTAELCYSTNGITYFSASAFYDARLQAEYQFFSQEALAKYAQLVKEKSLQRVETCTLDLCIQAFLQASVDTEELQDCDKCGAEKPHFRQTFLRHVGKELVFHLKRPSPSHSEKSINCPERLDLGHYMPGGGLYTLAAVVSLNGSIEDGQYVAYVRRESRWLLVEDRAVRAVSLGSNVLQAPYLVFYSQLD